MVCAALWFALWLTAFEVQPIRKMLPPTYPAATFLPVGAEKIRKFLTPSLFALPAEQGFSGVFPESRVHMELSLDQLEPTEQTEFYLPHKPVKRAEPDQASLMEVTPIPRSGLPAPGTARIKAAPYPGRIALFLSRELQSRANGPMQLALTGELPTSVRVHIRIQPDGTVDRTLFETPVENKALAGAIRQLQFTPATEQTTGWLEIRFTPGGDS